MKLNVLIVNQNADEGGQWAQMLEKSEYNVVGTSRSLSEMVEALSRQTIHIAICSALIVNRQAHKVLRSAMRFFPRVKIVVTGGRLPLPDLPELTNVIIKPKFDCELNGLFEFPQDAGADGVHDGLRLLLNENFLDPHSAEALLKQLLPEHSPHFAVISVLAGSKASVIFPAVSAFASTLPFGFAVQMNLDETCVLLSHSLSVKEILEISDQIRKNLLEKSNTGFNIGISRSRKKAHELFVCRNEALHAAESFGLYGHESVIHVDYVSDNDIWYAYPHHKEAALIDFAIAGNAEKALGLLDEVIAFLQGRDLRKQYVKKVAFKIWGGLNLAVASRAPAFESAYTDAMSFGMLFTNLRDDDIYEFLKNSIKAFADEMKAMADIRRDTLFFKLETLKNERRDIEISELINRYHTTVCFLNDAIVRNSDKNIFDFF